MQRLLAAAVFAAVAVATPAVAGPSTCDFIKIALADAPNSFQNLADGAPTKSTPARLKAYVQPTGWSICVASLKNGGTTLWCSINAPQGRPAGEGKEGLAKGAQVIAGCVPKGWSHSPRGENSVDFYDAKGAPRLTLVETDDDAGAYHILMLIIGPETKLGQ